jgi:hypothetical protein
VGILDKIKISCSKEQKEEIQEILLFSENCPFVNNKFKNCEEENCDACIKKNIEWEIGESEGGGNEEN